MKIRRWLTCNNGSCMEEYYKHGLWKYKVSLSSSVFVLCVVKQMLCHLLSQYFGRIKLNK